MSGPIAQKGGWTIVVLLFFFMFINFADKAIIGLAGVPIMKELNLTPKDFGLVNSSFFFLFSISAVVTGFIVNHVQARWALLVMALIWSLAQFPMGGTVGFGALVACRIALGAGEGPAYPVALHAAYKWFPNELRTLPTACIAQGAAIGVVIAVPVLDQVIETLSWHWAFVVLGVAGLVWVAAWAVLGKEGSIATTVERRSGRSLEHVPYSKLLLNGTVLASFAAGFGAYWGLSLLIGWFTPYLIKGLGYTQREASWITILPWAAGPFVAVFAGWFSQHLLARDVSTRIARGLFGGASRVPGWNCLDGRALCPERYLEDRVDRDRDRRTRRHLHHGTRHRQRDHACTPARRHVGDQQCRGDLGRDHRPLCHGQHGAECDRVGHPGIRSRVFHLRCGRAGLRADRHAVPAARARDRSLRGSRYRGKCLARMVS